MVDRFMEDKTKKVDVDITGGDAPKKTVNFNDLKTGGFIKQKQKDLFTVRLRCPGGRMDSAKLVEVSKIAQKYSKEGVVHFSFRQSLEILYVDYNDFSEIVKEIEALGLKVASCGPRVRVPTACGGCEYNPNGLSDTQGLAKMVDEKYFGTPTPHKFKTSFSGCPIDCARTNEMDMGFQGVVDPEWVEDLCTGCTICAEVCKEDAIIADPETGKPIFTEANCIYCGDCIRACPTEAWIAKRQGQIVRVGGKHGRRPKNGFEVARFLPDALIPEAIEKTIEWYQTNGERGERIATVLRRLGVEHYLKFMKPVFGEFILSPKNPMRYDEK
jgi:dissimilatory sulfite reductase (desulfoviridin) alpha/beta subunit